MRLSKPLKVFEERLAPVEPVETKRVFQELSVIYLASEGLLKYYRLPLTAPR